MFDPTIRVRVIADFKYKDMYYLTAGTYLSFDIYDSTKIAELISLYNPQYEYKEHIELPSREALPFHVKQQLDETYTSNKPADADSYLPKSDTPFYEVGGDTFSPFGASPYEDEEPVVVPLADNTYEPEVTEPKFPEIQPSILEDELKKEVTINVVTDVKEDVKDFEYTIEDAIEQKYSDFTNVILKSTEDELEDRSASDIKKAVAEIDPSYDYTNKKEAIKYILSLTK